MQYDFKSTEDKLHQLCNVCTSMSEWEVEFIDDVTKQFETKGYITERQMIKIWDIYMQRMCGQ